MLPRYCVILKEKHNTENSFLLTALHIANIIYKHVVSLLGDWLESF